MIKKIGIILLLVAVVNGTSAQQERKSITMAPLSMLNVLTFSGHFNYGYSKTNLGGHEDWRFKYGDCMETGVGMNFMIKNKWAFDLDWGYEFGNYNFANVITYKLGYKSMFIDLKVKKRFKPEHDHGLYLRGGFGINLGRNKSASGETTFPVGEYTLDYTGFFKFKLTPELGWSMRLSRKSIMDIGVIYKFGLLGQVFATTQSYYDELNNSGILETGSSATSANYFGIAVKYYHVLKEYEKKQGSRATPDDIF